MEGINSSNDFSSIIRSMLLSDVNSIKKSAITQHLANKVDNSAENAFNIVSSFGEYEMDEKIPENSTFSLHV